jgi:hypothetical protein
MCVLLLSLRRAGAVAALGAALAGAATAGVEWTPRQADLVRRSVTSYREHPRRTVAGAAAGSVAPELLDELRDAGDLLDRKGSAGAWLRAAGEAAPDREWFAARLVVHRALSRSLSQLQAPAQQSLREELASCSAAIAAEYRAEAEKQTARLFTGALPAALGEEIPVGEFPSDRLVPRENALLNSRVLRFAVERIGEQVGNGECWTLAADALVDAGGARPRGYTFGEEIPLSRVVPGDILQFTSAKWELRTPAGRLRVETGPRHTAIVRRVDGSRILYLHQNWGGVRRVGEGELDTAALASGTVQAYRPQPASRGLSGLPP